jgi:hypothetical protein
MGVAAAFPPQKIQKQESGYMREDSFGEEGVKTSSKCMTTAWKG